jgi:heme O synthase-like polyprenyltransferase
MVRTCLRPLVKGANPKIALGLGIGLGSAGLAGIYYGYGGLPATLGFTIWASYLFIYTKLKQTSEINTFVGAVIGSLPVYLGWAASGRSICMV